MCTTRTDEGLILMWQDTVVKETQELRKQYAEQFKHNPDAIFEDIRNRQEKSGRKCVTFPARRPKLKQNIA
jgi:hypothetical protein